MIDAPDSLTAGKPKGGRLVFRCPRCRLQLGAPFGGLARVRCPNCKHRTIVGSRELIKEEKRARATRAERERRLAAEVARWVDEGVELPDRISVLGRPQSGKSVYLAALYEELWGSPDDLKGRILHGPVHKAVLKDFADLAAGRWPPATASDRHVDLRLEYEDHRITMSTMDYPGEVFRQVFFENRIDSKLTRELRAQVRSSLGLLLLIDPATLCWPTSETLDVEFTAVAVLEHMAAMGRAGNVIVVLTKADATGRLVERNGGPAEFLSRYAPRIAALCPRDAAMTTAAVRAEAAADGSSRPVIDTELLANVRDPLRRLLDRLDRRHLMALEEQERRDTELMLAQERTTAPRSVVASGDDDILEDETP